MRHSFKLARTAFGTLATASFLLAGVTAQASQSSITEADGYSCMGVEHSRKDTERLALADAKRNAIEFARTHLESRTEMENFQLKQDLVSAFSRADVKVVEILNEVWDDPASGDCYNIRIRAEVLPPEAEMKKAEAGGAMLDDPTAPLAVKVWTNKTAFTAGESMKVYLKGNKPFYGRLIYVDASGTNVQILPNKHRSENYFQGGVIYEVPTAGDGFSLDVTEPFGEEQLVVYASTSPLGQVEGKDLGPVDVIEAPVKEIARVTRGITLTAAPAGRDASVSEFAESTVVIMSSAK